MSNSWTITDLDSTVELEDGPPAPPISAGEMLRELFMDEMDLSVADVAKASGLSTERVEAILSGASVTGEDSLRLGHAFKQGDGFFLGIQTDYDLEMAKRRMADQLVQLPALVAA